MTKKILYCQYKNQHLTHAREKYIIMSVQIDGSHIKYC